MVGSDFGVCCTSVQAVNEPKISKQFDHFITYYVLFIVQCPSFVSRGLQLLLLLPLEVRSMLLDRRKW